MTENALKTNQGVNFIAGGKLDTVSSPCLEHGAKRRGGKPRTVRGQHKIELDGRAGNQTTPIEA